MKDRKSSYKKVVSFCMILCVILSLGYNIKQLDYFEFEKQDFQHEVNRFVRWEKILSPNLRSANLTAIKQEIRNDEAEIFWVIVQSMQVRLGYLLYMKEMFMGFLISSFLWTIIYIHNKDGPKPKMTPA